MIGKNINKIFWNHENIKKFHFLDSLFFWFRFIYLKKNNEENDRTSNVRKQRNNFFFYFHASFKSSAWIYIYIFFSRWSSGQLFNWFLPIRWKLFIDGTIEEKEIEMTTKYWNISFLLLTWYRIEIKENKYLLFMSILF